MAYNGEVLIAILNKPLDLTIAREKGWYRIPMHSQEKWLKNTWPPQWLAFYQTKIFGTEAHSINYYAKVSAIKYVPRFQLFPDEPRNEKSDRRYYKLFIENLQPLPNPIPSRRHRRIIFIPTTLKRLMAAQDINDLYHGSPLEESLWAKFNRLNIPAEREEFITIQDDNFALDFAIYCVKGNLDVETDGDTWHHAPEQVDSDKHRDNLLNTVGWRVLRFTSHQIQEQMQDYCIDKVAENINRLGGIDTDRLIPRKIDPNAPPGTYQPSLFDDLD